MVESRRKTQPTRRPLVDARDNHGVREEEEEARRCGKYRAHATRLPTPRACLSPFIRPFYPRQELPQEISGNVFCIIGTLSRPRDDVEDEIRAAGGDVAKSVTKQVTILVASQPSTKKCLDAAKKGVMVVDEAWLQERLGTAPPPTKKGKKGKKGKAAAEAEAAPPPPTKKGEKGKGAAEVMNALLYRRTTKTLRSNGVPYPTHIRSCRWFGW